MDEISSYYNSLKNYHVKLNDLLQAVRALRETIGLDRAVESAVELTDDDDTLIIVTADHAHTFSIGGYPDRFADITREVYEGIIYLEKNNHKVKIFLTPTVISIIIYNINRKSF